MNMEIKMLIKQLQATNKSRMIIELKESDCMGGEMQELVNETIEVIKELNEQELLAIKTEPLSIY